MENGIAYLHNSGFKTKIGKSLNEKYGYFAGKDQQRLSDLHEMYADPEVDAIFCARGGWGGSRLLDKIDYKTMVEYEMFGDPTLVIEDGDDPQSIPVDRPIFNGILERLMDTFPLLARIFELILA